MHFVEDKEAKDSFPYLLMNLLVYWHTLYWLQPMICVITDHQRNFQDNDR